MNTLIRVGIVIIFFVLLIYFAWWVEKPRGETDEYKRNDKNSEIHNENKKSTV